VVGVDESLSIHLFWRTALQLKTSVVQGRMAVEKLMELTDFAIIAHRPRR